MGTDSGRGALSLFSRLEQKQERWEEAINSIDFLHSTAAARRGALSINLLAGLDARLVCCPLNSIARTIVKIGAHKTGVRESTRLVNKPLSSLRMSQYLRVTVSLDIQEARNVSRIRFHLPRAEDPKSYRLISLLHVSFKILEVLIYARVEPIVDPLLPREHAGFRHGRSTADMVTLLTQDIEDSFLAKKGEAVFVDFVERK